MYIYIYIYYFEHCTVDNKESHKEVVLKDSYLSSLKSFSVLNDIGIFKYVQI